MSVARLPAVLRPHQGHPAAAIARPASRRHGPARGWPRWRIVRCGKCRRASGRASALAQAALLKNPEVLMFLDEPTAGLDPKQIIETRELIKDSPATTPWCHQKPHTFGGQQTCQRVVIKQGQVVAVTRPTTSHRAAGIRVAVPQVEAGRRCRRGNRRGGRGVTGATSPTEKRLTASKWPA